MLKKIRVFLFGEPDHSAARESLRWHYNHHWYLPDIFKEFAIGSHTVIIPEKKNAHGAIIKAFYNCTRDQLEAIHRKHGISWPIPPDVVGVNFVVDPLDCRLRAYFDSPDSEIAA